jgi:exodeoxyribonuclease III
VGGGVLVVSWNVNSLKQRMPRLVELVERHDPDVICLQETKCGPEGFPHLELQAMGYQAADHSGGRWAGVAVIAKHDLVDVQVGLPDEPAPAEARWVEAAVDGVRVVSTYVVNGRSLDDPMYAVKLDFLRAMRARVAALQGAPLIVTGDFNIAPRDEDVWDPAAFVGSTHTSPDERGLLTEILDHGGLVDAWDVTAERGQHAFTWWDYRAGAFHKNLGMRIDLALVSEELAGRVRWVGIDRDLRKGTKPSDHAPLLVRIDG